MTFLRLLNYILKKYDDVTIINMDAMYYCASELNIDKDIRETEFYKDRYKLIKGNLCSYDLVNHIINDYCIEYIIMCNIYFFIII